MTTGAAEQVNRIVTLVAELSRADADGEPAQTLAAVAARHGTSASQILADVRALTAAADDPAAEWLSSLRIAQEGDRLMVASQGPFRRPVRLTAEEALALQVGLALERGGGAPLSDALRDLLRGGAASAGPPVAAGSAAETAEDRVVALARRCMDERRVLAITYAGEGDRAGESRLIEPHQVLAFEGRSYLIAWCREARGWRRFRADRVLEAAARDQTFAWRADFEPVARPEEVFRQGADAAVPVDVRFSSRIARWIAERYPGHVARPDGSVVVTFPVSSPGWLVRTVLEYGEDAEVLGPPPYREVVRRAVG
jgi:proteasome accessory factor C